MTNGPAFASRCIRALRSIAGSAGHPAAEGATAVLYCRVQYPNIFEESGPNENALWMGAYVVIEPDRKTDVRRESKTGVDKRHGTHRWICRVVQGEDNATEVPVGRGPIIVGASPSCDIVLADPTVSGRHVQIAMVENGIEIRDLGSTNGTFYRGTKFDCITVTQDTGIQLGNTVLEILSASMPLLPAGDRVRFGGLIGESFAMRQVFSILELASPTDVTVLIEGESGTGKEVAARAIHDHSLRAAKPFVVVDCCASPENLIESQLFGHKAGAFTGAAADRKGAFLEANGGTVFLDELGELPLLAQGKLLRVLESRTIQPIGSDRTIPLDVRIIAATNRDLSLMVEEKTFRFDLYHRLAVMNFTMPALRFHLEDIPLLVRHFYEGRHVTAGNIDGENLNALMRYDWPGNVRELCNVLERAWVLSGPRGATFQGLNLTMGKPRGEIRQALVDTTLPFKDAKEQWNDFFEKQYLSKVYAEYAYNISKAAERAGINRNHFRTLLQKHNIER